MMSSHDGVVLTLRQTNPRKPRRRFGGVFGWSGLLCPSNHFSRIHPSFIQSRGVGGVGWSGVAYHAIFFFMCCFSLPHPLLESQPLTRRWCTRKGPILGRSFLERSSKSASAPFLHTSSDDGDDSETLGKDTSTEPPLVSCRISLVQLPESHTQRSAGGEYTFEETRKR